jgi:ATP-dependent Zn protease
VGGETHKFTDLELTAYHEAGHAVAALVLNLEFDYVTIKASGNIQGHVSLSGVIETELDIDRSVITHEGIALEQRQQIENHIIMSYSGALANAYLTDNEPAYYGEAGDMAGTSSLLALVCEDWESESLHYGGWLLARARNLVKRHWESIEVIAKALLGNETLTVDDVRTTLSQHREAKLMAHPVLGKKRGE